MVNVLLFQSKTYPMSFYFQGSSSMGQKLVYGGMEFLNS